MVGSTNNNRLLNQLQAEMEELTNEQQSIKTAKNKASPPADPTLASMLKNATVTRRQPQILSHTSGQRSDDNNIDTLTTIFSNATVTSRANSSLENLPADILRRDR